ncbi:DUF5602 domain-containing protein [Flavobacterium sp. 7A]|uniref:DUF5602 domain-containing protein n=1 Tax=Flavobacterium sp. 7A TaxID=2940571 RepID=UPI002226BAEB|nr:DUF5602 domain-containing protein [Flavobacterium sp. 7A]MCW2119598.1 hypothetical protein [Flavobacterium sp. 7A]
MNHFTSLSKKIILICSFVLLYSCSLDEDDKTIVTYTLIGKTSETKMFLYSGPNVPIGSGTGHTWIKIDTKGFPQEIGIEITENAITNPNMEDDAMVGHTSTSMEHGPAIILPLHEKANQTTPFDHIGINWNPHGHEPVGVFDLPHFDFHFYIISIAEQLAIPAWSDATNALFNNYPAAEYLPANYITPPGSGTAEGQMGKHWVPANSSDYLPFTKLMVYGSYDGKVNFIEPMMTQAYLLKKIDTSESYSQPLSFQKKGNYPTKYNVYHDDAKGITYITLSDFITRN